MYASCFVRLRTKQPSFFPKYTSMYFHYNVIFFSIYVHPYFSYSTWVEIEKYIMITCGDQACCRVIIISVGCHFSNLRAKNHSCEWGWKQRKQELTRHKGHYCTSFSFLCTSLISISSLINVLLYYSACSAHGNNPEMCCISTRFQVCSTWLY